MSITFTVNKGKRFFDATGTIIVLHVSKVNRSKMKMGTNARSLLNSVCTLFIDHFSYLKVAQYTCTRGVGSTGTAEPTAKIIAISLKKYSSFTNNGQLVKTYFENCPYPSNDIVHSLLSNKLLLKSNSSNASQSQVFFLLNENGRK